ncbi:MAG: PorV/PorQ family protein [Candidatus Latescibacteria bacterium]|nr:PorV/PorQ family protein [bacterium]MBD3424066.1 PorV/PorQ family protein [Candidatus Latescibacterota bacterium]
MGMMTKRNSVIKSASVTIFLLFSMVPAGVLADGAGSTGAGYLELPVGGAMISMGETGAANRSAPFSWLINPASLSGCAETGIGIFHSQWIMDTNYNNVFAMKRIHPRFSIGAGLTYLSAPEIQGFNMSGEKTNPLENNNLSGSVGLAFSPVEYLGVGMNVKYLQEKIADYSARGYAVDLGVLVKPPVEGLRLGASVSNIGPKIKFIAHEEELPLNMRIGGSYSRAGIFKKCRFTIAADMVKPRYDDIYGAFGGELEIGEILLLRTGYVAEESRIADGFTAGGGINLGREFRIDYAFTPYGDLGDFHRISIFYRLGR